MPDFSPTNSWSNASKYAGISDARQVRQILDFANLIDFDMFPFLRLLGGNEYKDNKVSEKVGGMIQSVSCHALKPEIYDYEVAPTTFRLTTDTAATAVGSSVTLTMDSNAGINVGDQLNKVDQDLQGVVTSLTGTTQATITVTYGDGSAWLSDASVKYIEKLANARIDGLEVEVGNGREPTNRYNYLQFGVIPQSRGILQKQLELYAMHGKGVDADFLREKKMKLRDMQRGRESGFIAGRRSSTGTGASRYYTANGLVGWAGSVYNNTGTGGELPFDTFCRSLMPKARAGGGGMDVYGLAGLDVATVFTSYQQKQIRVTTPTTKYTANVKEIETPGGTLHLLVSEFMNGPARKGQMITFMPRNVRRAYLRNLDLQWVNQLQLGNELAERAAHLVCECLMVSNPASVCIHTNILK